MATLQLKMALIGFHRLRGGHDGKSVANAVIGLLDRAGVTVKVRALIGVSIFLKSFKVGHFTMDNASSNTTMMQELERKCKERDIDFDAADRQVMCYEHVVNLSSSRVIEEATSVAAVDLDEDWSGPPPPNSPDQQSYDDAIARDPIVLGRNVVRIIRASGTRHDAFNKVIENGNARGWFVVGQPPNQITIMVKPKQLLRDVRTRWDSVYYMLNRLREMRPVCFPRCDHFSRY